MNEIDTKILDSVLYTLVFIISISLFYSCEKNRSDNNTRVQIEKIKADCK